MAGIQHECLYAILAKAFSYLVCEVIARLSQAVVRSSSDCRRFWTCLQFDGAEVWMGDKAVATMAPINTAPIPFERFARWQNDESGAGGQHTWVTATGPQPSTVTLELLTIPMTRADERPDVHATEINYRVLADFA